MPSPLSYIEISQDALLGNFEHCKKILPGKTKIAAVVKANAYGHGMAEVVKIMEPAADYFQVDDINELEALRAMSQKPTFVFGYVADHELDHAVELGGTIGIYDIERLEHLDRIGEKRKVTPEVHIKIDALLGRQGILIDSLEAFLVRAKQLRHAAIRGVYAHFANIEDTSDTSHAERQIEILNRAYELCAKHGFKNLMRHISSTAGIFTQEQKLHSDIVRLGIGLYGLWPSEVLRNICEPKGIELTPALRWVTHVAQVKTVPKGFPIGYGLTHVTERVTKTAVIPQGYSDGYDRELSNKGSVLVRGQRAKVLGRVAMNMFVVDVTDIENVQREDEVVLLGAQGNEAITAEEIAEQAGTINYEVIARMSPLLPRVVVP